MEICYSWRECENGEIECECPNCEHVFIVINLEPYICDGCDIEFVLGDKAELTAYPCEDCQHYTYTGQLRMNLTCINCIRKGPFTKPTGFKERESNENQSL